MTAHICACLTVHAQAQPTKPLVQDHDSTHSYTSLQLYTRVLSLSTWLVQQHHIKPGDRIALLGYNSAAYMQCILGATACGGIATLLSWRWHVQELQHALHLTTPRVLIMDYHRCPSHLLDAVHTTLIATITWPLSLVLLMDTPDKDAQPTLHCIQNAAANTSYCSVHVLRLDHDDDHVVVQDPIGAPVKQRPPSVSSHQHYNPWKSPTHNAAVIVFTSGTTGASKAVVLSHGALVFQSHAKMSVVGYANHDTYVHTAPLFHVGGLSSALAILTVGAMQVVLPRFDPMDTIHAIHHHAATSFIAVPTMLTDLHHACNNRPLVTVRRVLIGGGTPSTMQLAHLQQCCPYAHVFLAYGMSEAASSITFDHVTFDHVTFDQTLTVDRMPRPQTMTMRSITQHSMAGDVSTHGQCVGRPPAGIAVRMSDTGEILTKGPHVMLGYWGDAGATAQALDTDGWLHTGDLGAWNATAQPPALIFTGRLKDVIKTGGENVHASMVQRALERHPLVVAAAVVGVPHARLGEAVAAWVVCQHDDGGSDDGIDHHGTSREVMSNDLSLAALQAHCKHVGIAGVAVPRVLLVTYEKRAGNDGEDDESMREHAGHANKSKHAAECATPGSNKNNPHTHTPVNRHESVNMRVYESLPLNSMGKVVVRDVKQRLMRGHGVEMDASVGGRARL